MSRRKQARPIRVLEPEDALQPGGTAEPAGEYRSCFYPFCLYLLRISSLDFTLGPGTETKGLSRNDSRLWKRVRDLRWESAGERAAAGGAITLLLRRTTFQITIELTNNCLDIFLQVMGYNNCLLFV
jgi:hypothetical protein